MLSVKQDSIKYHILSLWYDSTWNWTQISRAIGEHSNHYANVRFYHRQRDNDQPLQCYSISYCNTNSSDATEDVRHARRVSEKQRVTGPTTTYIHKYNSLHNSVIYHSRTYIYIYIYNHVGEKQSVTKYPRFSAELLYTLSLILNTIPYMYNKLYY